MNIEELTEIMHGRKIVKIPIKSVTKECADCYGEVSYVILELDKSTYWYWCGLCEIGG